MRSGSGEGPRAGRPRGCDLPGSGGESASQARLLPAPSQTERRRGLRGPGVGRLSKARRALEEQPVDPRVVGDLRVEGRGQHVCPGGRSTGQPSTSASTSTSGPRPAQRGARMKTQRSPANSPPASALGGEGIHLGAVGIAHRHDVDAGRDCGPGGSRPPVRKQHGPGAGPEHRSCPDSGKGLDRPVQAEPIETLRDGRALAAGQDQGRRGRRDPSRDAPAPTQAPALGPERFESGPRSRPGWRGPRCAGREAAIAPRSPAPVRHPLVLGEGLHLDALHGAHRARAQAASTSSGDPASAWSRARSRVRGPPDPRS